MTNELTLYTALQNSAALTSLVGTRVYPSVAPDNAAVPYVTYQAIATDPYNMLVGAPGSERKVFQVNCISNTYTQAKAMAAAAQTAIDVSIGYKNGGGDDYFPATENHRVWIDFALIGT